jgi:type I restriction enzyme S subunit
MKWPEYQISQLAARFISGGTPSTKLREYWEGEIPWITGADFIDGELVLGRRYINEAAIKNSATKIVPKGSVLMVTRTGVGKIAMAPVDIAISQDFTGIVLKEVVDPKFALAAIRSRMGILLAAQRGATIKGVIRDDVKRLSIPLPALSEQRRIVEILDQADALRKKRAESDAKAARILPSLFYKMFGDPATNPKGWPVKTLGEVTVGKPEYGANASAVEWSEGKPRYVRITDITDAGHLRKDGIMSLELEDWEPYRLFAGDLLFARSGNTVGKTYLYRPEDGLCAYAGYLIRFKPDFEQALPWCLFSMTQTDYYRSWVEARKRVAGQPNINGKEYASLRVLCPPTALQAQFAGMAEELVRVFQNSGRRDQRTEHLFDVLLHRAFDGELTAKWREAHMKELLDEMEMQARILEEIRKEI